MRRLVGYARVAPREDPRGRPGLREQRERLRRTAERRGWQLVSVEEDVRSGRTMRRAGLQAALAACRDGRADGIAVAALDRLTYSLDDLAHLVADLHRSGTALVVVDRDLDTAEAGGAAVAEVLSEAATWRPRNPVRRIRSSSGGRIGPGRPPSIPAELAARIRAMREAGATLQAICDTLNEERVPTPRGGSLWRPTSLRAVLRPRSQGGS